MRSPFHPDDAVLARLLDGELDRVALLEVETHLAGCASCRDRVEEFRAASEAYATLRPEPGVAGVPRWRMAIRSPRRAWAATVATGALIVLAAVSMRPRAAHLPDSRLTPGAVLPLSRDSICAQPLDADAREIPARLARRVFDLYGIRKPRSGAYEVDYLITPALGGSDEIANLWPQPYSGGEWSARVKDALEDRLRREVCAGRLDLASAQRDIAADWVSAYRKYFRSEHPLAEHALFVKDRPWEDRPQ